MKKRLLVCLAFGLSTLVSYAQAPPPDTEIFVFNLKEEKGNITIEKGKNVTERKGYDNQPYFYGEDRILYTAYDNGQTDIIMLDLSNNKKTNLTNSKDSEYSAAMVPGSESFAAVRVEDDGAQRLWLFQLNTNESPQLVFENIAPVGYHAWSGSKVAMFILGTPVTLLTANTKKPDEKKITDNIGRTLKLIPGTLDFAFERTEENGDKNIYRLNSNSSKYDLIVKKPKNSSDWTITKEGTYVTSSESKILTFNPKYNNEWKEITNFSSMGFSGITRMAINENNTKIAIVINQ
ncbi:TolB family protein [Roseivirga echinicomitans]|uniref:S9 family peptidase n=1 Tax=Roseivirga echinicomitans TaxID=296218 RepID=A0A150X2P2_9BACT|nr:hypothetical protein [Roseivirga echinicomitans]KYG72988.1 hypothetical protein AWN68_09845 [Roseivirga echinicomitans]